MSAAVGADIESLCSKCGDVWHVVVAKVGDRIAKVQCKQCQGTHRHRPLGGKPAPAKPRPAVRARRAGAAKAAVAEPTVVADPSRPVRRYSPSESYEAGDRIQHFKFGQGVVEGSAGPGKVQVHFPGGRRILAQAKTASTLVRRLSGPED